MIPRSSKRLASVMTQRYGTRRSKAKEETKRLILEHAYRLFEEKGYPKTTMRELAAKAGVGLGTIFQHFPEKSMLLVAAYEEDMEREVEKAFKTLPDASLKNQLLHFGKTFYAFYEKRPQLFRVVLAEIAFTNRKTQEKIDALVFGFWERLAKLFQDAIRRGELKAGIDVPTAVKAFWSYYSFTLYMGLKMPSFQADLQVQDLETLIDQHFDGLTP